MDVECRPSSSASGCWNSWRIAGRTIAAMPGSPVGARRDDGVAQRAATASSPLGPEAGEMKSSIDCLCAPGFEIDVTQSQFQPSVAATSTA
jgi:hypothetical protein